MNRRNRFGLMAMALAVVVVTGCVPQPPAPEVALKSDLPRAPDGAYLAAVGQALNFTAEVSGGDGQIVFSWLVPGQMPQRDDDSGTLAWTFTAEGDYEVQVIVTDGRGWQANDRIMVRIGPTETPPVVEPLKIEDGLGFVSGGTIGTDGKISVGPGGVLTFNLTNAVTGGVLPYSYWLNGVEQTSPVFFWIAPVPTVTTSYTLTIVVRDASGSVPPLVLTIVVVVIVPEVNPPIGEFSVTLLAPAQQQTFVVGSQVEHKIQIDGGVGPYLGNWLLANGTVVSFSTDGPIHTQTFLFSRTTSPVPLWPDEDPRSWAHDTVWVSDRRGEVRTIDLWFRVKSSAN